MSTPAPPQMARPTSSLQVGTMNSQNHDDVIRGDQMNEPSGDDGSEYDPNSRDDSYLAAKRPRKYNPGQNKMKLDRHQRALVRALAKRAKWDPKEIAAVFRVTLAIVQKTVTNAYVAVDDIVSEDANYYNESEFEKLIMKRPSPMREKKKGRKKQDKMFAKKFRQASPVPRRQRLFASPPASVHMEVEPNPNTARGIFRMFRDEATLVHGEKVHSILEDIGIEDDETMLAVLTMDDERLNGMLQEAKRLNLVEKFSVIQAMRDFGKNHQIAK